MNRANIAPVFYSFKEWVCCDLSSTLDDIWVAWTVAGCLGWALGAACSARIILHTLGVRRSVRRPPPPPPRAPACLHPAACPCRLSQTLAHHVRVRTACVRLWQAVPVQDCLQLGHKRAWGRAALHLLCRAPADQLGNPTSCPLPLCRPGLRPARRCPPAPPRPLLGWPWTWRRAPRPQRRRSRPSWKPRRPAWALPRRAQGTAPRWPGRESVLACRVL